MVSRSSGIVASNARTGLNADEAPKRFLLGFENDPHAAAANFANQLEIAKISLHSTIDIGCRRIRGTPELFASLDGI